MKGSTLAKQFKSLTVSYSLACNKLLEEALDNNCGELFSPVCYLGRHTIELQLKTIILMQKHDFIFDNNLSFIENGKKHNIGTHNLKKLIDYIYEFDSQCVVHSYTTNDLKEIFNEIITLTKTDKTGEIFKYPITHSGKHNFNNSNFEEKDIADDISKPSGNLILLRGSNFSCYSCTKQQESFLKKSISFFRIIDELNKLIGVK